MLSCEGQVKAGHDLHLAFGPIYGPEGSLLERAKTSGATIHEIASLRREVNPVHDAQCYFALRRLIREIKPDVVHTHSSKAGIVGRAAAWAEKVPTVIHTVHGLPFHDHQPRWVHHLYVLLERWAAKRCHHLVAITQEMVNSFDRKQIASAERFTVIPSGIDENFFRPKPEQREIVRREFGIPIDAEVVGLVARLDPLKGHADLLDILPQLREHSRKVWLFFVGDGFAREEIEAHASCKSGNIVFTGLAPLERVPDLLATMDIMVLPSYQEGQSRTLPEALLCGIPIAAYDVGGIKSVCIDGETGRLVPSGDKVKLSDAILWTFDHPDESAAMVKRGQALVREKFSASGMVRLLDGLYSQLQKKLP